MFYKKKTHQIYITWKFKENKKYANNSQHLDESQISKGI